MEGQATLSTDSRASSAVAAAKKGDLEHLRTSVNGSGKMFSRTERCAIECQKCETLNSLSTPNRGAKLWKERSPALASKLQVMVIGMIMNGC